jgi:acetyl-CoA carboxylase carboxyl transferase subunit alpha
LGIIDGVITEPPGGAHNDHAQAAALLDAVLQKQLADLKSQPIAGLLSARYNKFRNMAQFFRAG